jgi:ABC-2 type transport system ATP-binding protein
MHAAPDHDSPLQVENVTKVFRDFWHRPKVTAVREVSFEVKRGEVFGLLGPNGSGKSTTIKMMLGLLHPTRGHLRVLGRSPREVRAKARVGYLPEESYLYPYLTSEETLDFYGRLFDLNRAERRQRIEQLLEMIGLTHARRRTVGEFSKGMARRIGLAQALINDPDLIILDEPTSGLDPLGCRQMKDLILTLARRGKTILMTSHLLADVEDVCDRMVILYNGRVQAAGSVHELLEQPGQSRIVLPAELPPETLRQVLASLREVLGREPEVDHPRKDLEQFFLEVVAKARAESAENTGASAGRSVAHYLDQPPPAPPPADVNQALAALVAPRAGDTSEIRNSTSEI